MRSIWHPPIEMFKDVVFVNDWLARIRQLFLRGTSSASPKIAPEGTGTTGTSTGSLARQKDKKDNKDKYDKPSLTSDTTPSNYGMNTTSGTRVKRGSFLE